MKKLGRLILWQRARDVLRREQPILIGVTGSTGKTMAKNAIALALEDKFHVRTTKHSYNTRIGVALTILGITPTAMAKHWFRLLTGSRLRELTSTRPDIVIVELGADRPGDIDFFARLLPFKIGIVTNVQSTHLRLFINKELVAHELTSLIVDLPKEGGTAILNSDDPLVLAMSEHSQAPTITFGASQVAAVQLRRCQRLPKGNLACEILLDNKIHELHLQHIIAEYQVSHILAALATVQSLQGNITKAAERLQQLKPPPGRMRRFFGRQGSFILDDSYSASPEATIAALKLLRDYPGQRKIAILGDMLDLGAASTKQHEAVGHLAAEVADVFVTVGEKIRDAAAAALKTSGLGTDVHHFDSSLDVGKWIPGFLKSGDVVLVKGSRHMHMEEVVKRLLAHPTRDSSQLVK